MVDTAEAKQVTSAASSLLFPEIDLDVAPNATYTRADFDPVLSCISFNNEFASAGAKTYQCARGDNVSVDTDARNPLARTYLYNLRDLSADGIDTDRASVHTANGIERLFERYDRMDEIRIPTACPELNPCEGIWDWSKLNDMGKVTPQDFEELISRTRLSHKTPVR